MQSKLGEVSYGPGLLTLGPVPSPSHGATFQNPPIGTWDCRWGERWGVKRLTEKDWEGGHMVGSTFAGIDQSFLRVALSPCNPHLLYTMQLCPLSSHKWLDLEWTLNLGAQSRSWARLSLSQSILPPGYLELGQQSLGQLATGTRLVRWWS